MSRGLLAISYIQMHIPNRYFHDRIVLLLLTVNAFLSVLGPILILLRLDTSRPTSYIVEYRSQLGLSAFRSGTSTAILSFILFSIIVMVFHTALSMRVYTIRRHFALAVVAMATLLLILSIVVSNALIVL